MQRTLSAPPPRALAWLLCALVTLVASPARAVDPNVEKQATTLQRRAIEEDNLNLAYPEAIKKLATAISKCGEEKCNPSLKGALYRDLGAVLILSGSVEEGRAAFAKALSFDPALELDPAYRNPMLDGAWRDAKKKAGIGGGGGGEPPAAAGAGPAQVPGGEAAGGQQPASGDFAHVPAGAELVRTPLPVYAEYLGTEKLVRVVVKYKGPGMADWKPIDLRKLDTGYGGLIPCKDVAEGVVQYYIQGYGTSDDPIAAAGSRSKPFSVPIKSELTGPAPSLPGQESPKQCADNASGSDCPPDFPGCHQQKKSSGDDCTRNSQCESGECSGGKCIEKNGEAEECEKDSECASGTCADGKCTAPKKLGGESCESEDDCASGVCRDGKCGEGGGRKGGKVPKIWVGVGIAIDFYNLPSAADVCKLQGNPPSPVNNAGYQCVDPNTGANFPGTNRDLNTSITQGRGDSVGGGFALGNIRLLASFDYALTMNFLVGARAGYVLLTDPASAPGPAFAPVHLEARGTYLLGKDALASGGVSPLLFVGLGVGEFDAAFGVQVLTPGQNPSPRNENAWIVAGPFFATVGVGARLSLGPNLAATAALKGEGAFGGSAGFLPGVAPEVGLQLGL
ncbi:MAG: hypothetical protein JOZ69_18580 [Myxococcales bacterium]|nr:hypothetical protein [Myxococcales bacterium]